MNQELAPARLLIQILAWVNARPRSYIDTMEAWRSSCPRHPVWDDALIDGLIRIETSSAAGMSGSSVVLTDAGRAALLADAAAREQASASPRFHG